jgi:LacI family transcriptional regulator
MPATIKDVAHVAQVSIKTVSRVINAEPHVTEETRSKVLAAVRAVGYAPNISARRLVQNKSYMICVLMYPDYYQSASSLLNITMDTRYEEDYEILIQPYYPALPRSRQKLVNQIYEHRIDGFVTTPPCDAEGFVADLLNTYKIPLVQINPFTRSEYIPTVTGDDQQGAYAMTEHLISLGHRQIYFLIGPRNMRASFDRLAGYQSALQAYNLPYNPDMVMDADFTFEGGYKAAQAILLRSHTPTAIFAGSDQAAYGAMFAAQEAGLLVPNQISIGGFDDLSFSKHIWPGLTTIHQPTEKIVEAATRLLIRILKNEENLPNHLLLPSHLVIRGSTANPGR